VPTTGGTVPTQTTTAPATSGSTVSKK
jgi:hypothetical protein